MKAKPLTIQVKKILFAVAAVMMIFFFNSCAKKAIFLNSSVVPAAKGTVKVKTDKNNNYVINIQLINLAEPDRLQPPRNAYVVWMVTTDNYTKNIGQINSSTSFLSKQLKASFETISTFKPSKIFITAEDDANIQNPVGPTVLSTDFL
jgi:hypothetical protein